MDMHPIASDAPGEIRPPHLRDLIGLGRLMLYGLGFWTAVALVFAVEHALLLRQAGAPEPWYRLAAGQLASWWPCVLLTPPAATATLSIRARFRSFPGALGAHTIALLMFLSVGGALMGILESLLPWETADGGLLAAATLGMMRYLGPDLLLYLLIVAATLSAAHAWESRRRAIAAATYASQLAEARLHVLNAQLQPHFLFNALHAISALIWEDPARADRLLARLSEMLRLTLRSGTRVETTLTEEVALLQRYAEIQEARYGDRLRVLFDVDSRIGDALVPRLILQPLVENAIRHGITRRISPGRVEVKAWEDQGRLHLIVRDDGVGLRSDAPVREGVGLSITRARLRQLYGSDQRFALAPAPEGGAVCLLSFPLRLAESAS
jgi:hypothetical protein